jgi:hypothetical protein
MTSQNIVLSSWDTLYRDREREKERERVLANSKKRGAMSFEMCRAIVYLLLVLSVNLLLPDALSPTLINIKTNSSEFLRTTSS